MGACSDVMEACTSQDEPSKHGWCVIWQAYHTECMITGCQDFHDTLRREAYALLIDPGKKT